MILMTRPSKTKQHRRDALREELRSRQYLSRIHKLLDADWPVDVVATNNCKLNGFFRLLNKSLPDCRELPVRLDIVADGDTGQMAAAVVNAVVSGNITPSEGNSLLNIISKASNIQAVAEFERRIAVLEQGRIPDENDDDY